MARGFGKNRFKKNNNFKEKHNQRNEGGKRRRLLDMGREKYFRFDLTDLFEEWEIQENKNTIMATIVNKLITQSYDDTVTYLERLKTDKTLSKTQTDSLEKLMKRYTKLR